MKRIDPTGVAVGIFYFINGAVTVQLGVRLVDLAERADLGLGALGLALTGQAVGLIAGLVVFGWLVARADLRRRGYIRLAVVGAALYAGVLPVIGHADSAVSLAGALVAFGLVNIAIDLAAPRLGQVLERSTGRRIMSRLELCFTLGLLAGSVLAGASLGRVSVTTHFGVAAVCGVALALTAGLLLRRSALRDDAFDQDAPGSSAPGPGVRRWSWTLVGISAVAAASFAVEALNVDWAVAFLQRELAVATRNSGWATVAFTVGLICSQLIADRTSERFGRVRVVQVGAGMLVVATGVIITAPSLWVALAGFAFAGLGVGPIHPMAMSAAGEQPRPVMATAVTNAAGYGGLIGVKPLIGVTGDVAGLHVAMGWGLAFAFLAAACAQTVRGREGVHRIE